MLGFAPVRARCGNSVAAWITGVLAESGAHGLGGQGSRKYSALEGYDHQYWSIHSNTLAWRTPLWQRSLAVHSLQGRRVRQNQRDPVHINPILPPPRVSSAPVRFECEGGSAACLVGTLVASGVQGHKLSPPQELRPYQSLVLNLL